MGKNKTFRNLVKQATVVSSPDNFSRPTGSCSFRGTSTVFCDLNTKKKAAGGSAQHNVLNLNNKRPRHEIYNQVPHSNWQECAEQRDESIVLLHCNVRSFNSKEALLSAYLENFDVAPTIICLNETWLDASHVSEYCLTGSCYPTNAEAST